MRHKRGPSLCHGFSSDMYGIVFIFWEWGVLCNIFTIPDHVSQDWYYSFLSKI